MSKLKMYLPYLICFGLGGAVFLAMILFNRIWTLTGSEVFQLLSDACLLPGVLIGGVGLLVFASNDGFFNMLAYGFIHFFDLFRPNVRNERYRNYYEYKQAKAGRKHPFAHMLIVGLFFLFFSGIFSLIWYSMG